MLNKEFTLFTTLLIKNLKMVGLLDHLHLLKKKFYKFYGYEWNYCMDDIWDFLSQQRLCSSQSYRFNIYAQQTPQFKLTPYLFDLTPDKHIAIYPTAFYEPYPHYKKNFVEQRLRLLNEAKECQYDDWIFYDEKKNFLETTFCNLFWIREKVFYFPSPSLPLYQGVTLNWAIQIAKELGHAIQPICENQVENLYRSSVYICNSLKGLCPVKQINHRTCIIDSTLNQKINQAYYDLVEKKSFPLPIFSNNHEK